MGERARVFLCHSSGDKEKVRDLYHRLRNDGVDCWFDEESLLPGQDWEFEITRAIRASSYVLACISESSTTKAGYVQKELKKALDIADEQPEGSTYLIPVRLEECEIPERLRRWQWVDLLSVGSYERLVSVLRPLADDDKSQGSQQHVEREVMASRPDPMGTAGIYNGLSGISIIHQSADLRLADLLFQTLVRNFGGKNVSMYSRFGKKASWGKRQSELFRRSFSKLAQCGVMLILIEHDQNWLNNSAFLSSVHSLIEEAAGRQVIILPVSIEGAPIPTSGLPVPLIAQSALQLSWSDFKSDIVPLVIELKRITGPSAPAAR